MAQKPQSNVPYRISGYTKFLDKNGYPAVRPPWGTLNAINLNTGAYVWKTVFGEHPELAAGAAKGKSYVAFALPDK